MYNPHARPDYADEAALMSRGRLIKARLVDQDIPNVDWFWIQTGNCFACKYFVAAGVNGSPKCLNKKISHSDFLNKYTYVNTCPEFEHGASEQSDALDVMKAAGLVKGDPSQEIEIIVNEPWSMDLAERAHREQSYFMDMAAQVDAGGDNITSRGEYVDMTDDLERTEVTQVDGEFSINQQRDKIGRWTKGIGTKHPATMKPGEINKELDKIQEHRSEVTDALIDAGHGSKLTNEVHDMADSDPIAKAAKTLDTRHRELRSEVDARSASSTQGRGMHRLPTGKDAKFYGPRKSEDEVKPKKKKVAVIGLAANPPHKGHLALARHVRDTGGFDEVWLMPANKHVFKPDMAEPEHRLAMTRGMLEGEPGIEVSDAEIRHDLPGPTIDTVEKLKEEYGDTHDFSWVVSQDEANALDHWVRSDELKKKIPFVVTPRPGVETASGADWSKEPPHRILEGGADLVDVSSTKLRNMIEDDQGTDEFLHQSVAEYIHGHGLYKKRG